MPKGLVRPNTGSYSGRKWLHNCACDSKAWDQAFFEMQDLQATDKAGANFEADHGASEHYLVILTSSEREPDRREMLNVLKTDDDTGTLTTGEPLHMDACLVSVDLLICKLDAGR